MFVFIFARFKVNCVVTTGRSFANFKLIMSRHRKELRGAPKARTLGHGLPGLCVNSSLMGVTITVLCNYYYESDAHLQRG